MESQVGSFSESKFSWHLQSDYQSIGWTKIGNEFLSKKRKYEVGDGPFSQDGNSSMIQN